MKFVNETEELIKVQVEEKVYPKRSVTIKPGKEIEAETEVYAKYYKKAGLTQIKEKGKDKKEEKPKDKKPESIMDKAKESEKKGKKK